MKNRLRYIVPSAIIVVAMFVFVDSGFLLTDTKVIENDGVSTPVGLPYFKKDMANGKFRITGRVAGRGIFEQKVVRIVADDGIDAIRINGRPVSLAHVPAAKRSDYVNGFNLDWEVFVPGIRTRSSLNSGMRAVPVGWRSIRHWSIR